MKGGRRRDEGGEEQVAEKMIEAGAKVREEGRGGRGEREGRMSLQVTLKV